MSSFPDFLRCRSLGDPRSGRSPDARAAGGRRRRGKTGQSVWDDLLIRNLRVHKDDEHFGIGPSPANPEPPTYALKFCPVSGFESVIALVNEDGKIAMQDTRKRRTVVGGGGAFMAGQQAHHNAVYDLAWSPTDAAKLITVSGDQSAKLWDISGPELNCLRTYKEYTRSVKVVEFRPMDPHVFATGSRENSILIWDLRCRSDRTPENCVRNAHSAADAPAAPARQSKRPRLAAAFSPSSSAAASVTGLRFRDEHTLISCGDTDGVVKVWDLRKNYGVHRREPRPRQRLLHPGRSSMHGFTALAIDPRTRNVLYAACMDSRVYRFGLGDGSPESKTPDDAFGGYQNASFFIRLAISPDGRYLVSGSSDAKAYVWSTGCARASASAQASASEPIPPLATLDGHDAEVTCVDWSAVGWTLVTAADDMKHRVWRLSRDRLEHRHDVRGEAVMTGGGAACALASPTTKTAPDDEAAHGGDLDRTPSTGRRIAMSRQLTPSTAAAAGGRAAPPSSTTPSGSNSNRSKGSILSYFSTPRQDKENAPSSAPPPTRVGRSSCERQSPRRAGLKRPSDVDAGDGVDARRSPLSPLRSDEANEHVLLTPTPRSADRPRSEGFPAAAAAARNIAGLLDEESAKTDPPSSGKRAASPASETRPPMPRFEAYPCSPRKMTVRSSPLKSSPRKLLVSPRKLVISPRKVLSPTANLPDLALDGRSPNERAAPRLAAARKRQVDWLTSLSQQKRLQAPTTKPSGAFAAAAAASKRKPSSATSADAWGGGKRKGGRAAAAAATGRAAAAAAAAAVVKKL